MPDLHDTSEVPDRPEYWDQLAERIAHRATAPSGAVAWLAESRGARIAALLGLAASLAFVLGRSESVAGAAGATLLRAVAPGDALGRAFAVPGTPPTIGSLLFVEQRSGRPR